MTAERNTGKNLPRQTATATLTLVYYWMNGLHGNWKLSSVPNTGSRQQASDFRINPLCEPSQAAGTVYHVLLDCFYCADRRNKLPRWLTTVTRTHLTLAPLFGQWQVGAWKGSFCLDWKFLGDCRLIDCVCVCACAPVCVGVCIYMGAVVWIQVGVYYLRTIFRFMCISITTCK